MIFHQKFEEIHPFEDGNGRVGREILNFMLRQHKFPEIYITPGQSSQYYSALEEGNAQNYVPLLDFIMNRIIGTIQYLYSKTSFVNFVKSDVL
jgi:Fic family protein